MTAFAEEAVSSRIEGKETKIYTEDPIKGTIVTSGGRVETMTNEHKVGKETTKASGRIVDLPDFENAMRNW